MTRETRADQPVGARSVSSCNARFRQMWVDKAEVINCWLFSTLAEYRIKPNSAFLHFYCKSNPRRVLLGKWIPLQGARFISGNFYGHSKDQHEIETRTKMTIDVMQLLPRQWQFSDNSSYQAPSSLVNTSSLEIHHRISSASRNRRSFITCLSKATSDNGRRLFVRMIGDYFSALVPEVTRHANEFYFQLKSVPDAESKVHGSRLSIWLLEGPVRLIAAIYSFVSRAVTAKPSTVDKKRRSRIEYGQCVCNL